MSRNEAFHHWDQHIEFLDEEQAKGRKMYEEPHGTMPVEEMLSRIDANFAPWERFQEVESYYNHPLGEHIAARGMKNPIVLHPTTNHRGEPTRYREGGLHPDEYIYDGHHRLAAAQFAGLKEVPYVRRKWVEDTLT